MGTSVGVAIVSADPRVVFRVVNTVQRLAVPLHGIARSPDEVGVVLQGGGRIVVAGIEELPWLGSSPPHAPPPSARIVVLAAVTTEAIVSAIARGATAVIPAEAIETQLPHAVQHARAGMVWLPSTVMPSLACALTSPRSPVAPVPAGATLSGREADVIALFAKGYSNKEIAEHLGIATKTVETYKHRVKLRFNVSERRDLVALAEQEGLLHRHTPPVGQAAIPGRRADGTGRA